jgi:HPr kinase/phosphorylase
MKRRGAGVHATAMIVGETGVLILGPSGAGKSRLALALLAAASRIEQFAALVGDDRVWLRGVNGRLVASGAPGTAGLIERRAGGLVAVDWEPAALIQLVLDLNPPGAPWPRYPEEPNILVPDGVKTPRLAVDSSGSAADQAQAALERIARMAKESCAGKRISLEQCAAVHKNSQLASSPAALSTQDAPAG